VDLTGRVEIATGDIGEWAHVLETIRRYRVDCIYHAVAILGSACEASAASGFRVNVVGTMKVLEAAQLLEVSDVMFVGSGTTFGTASEPAQIDDITRHRPENMYGISKLCGELLGRQYHRQSGVNFRGARYAMIVGPTRQITHHYGGWSGVIERATQGQPYTVHADPSSPCAYIYVKNAVRALKGLRRTGLSRSTGTVVDFDWYFASPLTSYPLLQEMPMDMLLAEAHSRGISTQGRSKRDIAAEIFVGARSSGSGGAK